ncbi:MAG TPA: hypothetical protein VHM90_01390 [Phycisphaerae bacterium]|nr:hypothetical protein [Phycisphaerae bacterium]
MIAKILAILLALPAGGWMLADGIYCLIHGKYIGPETPGPWSIPFVALGINPFRLAPLFIVLGVLWLSAIAFLLTAPPHLARAAWLAALGIAVASLWYLPVGTFLSVAYILLLLLNRARFVSLRPGI